MQLSDIDAQIAQLEAQKAELVKAETDKAMKKVKDALAELNALGNSYELVQNVGTLPRTRRTGVRESIYNAVKSSTGVTPGQLATALSMEDKAGKQSISNALSALKKSGRIAAENGVYTAK